MDFDARKRFGNVVNCRLDWNLKKKKIFELHCQIWHQIFIKFWEKNLKNHRNQTCREVIFNDFSWIQIPLPQNEISNLNNYKVHIKLPYSPFCFKTGMRKFGPWGVLWSLCLRYFPSRYDPEIWHTGQGRQMRPSDFFLGQDLFWWLQNGASKRPYGPWVLSDWEEMGSWNFAGSFLDSIQDLEILFSSIGQSVVL